MNSASPPDHRQIFLSGFAPKRLSNRKLDRARATNGTFRRPRLKTPRPTVPLAARGSLSVLFTRRPLLVYAGCAMLFHFANAPLLPRFFMGKPVMAIS